MALSTRWLRGLLLAIICALIAAGAISAQPAPTGPTLAPDHVLYPHTIAGLQARAYPSAGTLNARMSERTATGLTRHDIDYQSDGLTITGMMYVPAGSGPFPVVVMLHGYYDRETYWSGLGTWQEAEYLAQRGYMTISPDLRTWGGSDSGINLFASGLTVDAINLISALENYPDADITRLGIWGHSMGGGVATKALTIDPRIRAGVLYAPNSANDADLIERWGPACRPGQMQAAGAHCNPAEVLPSDQADPIVAAYFAAAGDPEILRAFAPIEHLDALSAPVQIHVGTNDGATLVQTPPDWSQALYDALVTAGGQTEYHRYPDQGHFLTGGSWSLMMQRTAAFFDRYLSGE